MRMLELIQARTAHDRKPAHGIEFTAVYLCFVLATLILRWNELDLPFYSDEVDYYSLMTREFHRAKFLDWSHPLLWVIYHPPLYYLYLALATLLFGWKIEVMRIGALLVSSLLVTGIYALAREHAGRIAALVASAAFFSSTLYLSHAVSIEPDLPTAAFFVLALWKTLQEKLRAGSVLYALSCLVNAPTIALLPAFAWFLKSRQKKRWNEIAIFFAPALAGLAVWSVLCLIALKGLGNFLDPANVVFLRDNPRLMDRFLSERPHHFFLESGRWAISVLLLGWLGWRKWRSHSRIPVAGMTALIVTQFLFLVFVGINYQRYASDSIALVYVLLAWALTEIRAAAPVQLCFLALVSALSFQTWNSVEFASYFAGDRSAFIDQIRTLQKVASHLEKNWPNALIYADWLWSAPLESEWAGYVARRFESAHIQRQTLEGTRIPPASEKKALLVYCSPEDPPAPDYRFKSTVELRKKATGPCFSIPGERSKFHVCPIN